MVINDIHRHVVFEETKCFPHNTFCEFVKNHSPHIENCAIFLNPHYKRLYDCPFGHQYMVVDVDNDKIKFECAKCKKVSYVGTDPYREGNIKLIEMCNSYSHLYPFIYLSLSDNTMQHEVEYFESNFESRFWGIKVHPQFCGRKMSDIYFDSHYPMVIHCGVSEYDNPMDVIQFAKRYSGNVVLAHLARCEETVLKEISKTKNLFIDTSPTYLPFQIVRREADRYFQNVISNVDSVTQLFKNLINVVGVEKIIFGTDAPWGNDDETMRLYEEIDIPSIQKARIFRDNFNDFLRRDIL